ncbi:hypothetical protein BDF14DRAFT_1798207 [Spinellus fusiger]|nr:hypothetical protein BDF14DRAFT_1798207 [Spinellus fusiger]
MPSSTASTQKNTSAPPQKSQSTIELRPYFDEKDLKYVQYLFCSTYLNHVPAGVRLRLKSPYIIGGWILVYAYLLAWVPSKLSVLHLSSTLLWSVRAVVTIVSAVGGVIFLLWYVDKFDVTERILQGIENDLKDPSVYYRGYPGDPLKGNFWLLTINGNPVGCIGMDQHLTETMDQRIPSITSADLMRMADSPDIARAEWKGVARTLAKVDDAIRLVLVSTTERVKRLALRVVKTLGWKEKSKARVLFKAHRPNEASVRRLAIKSEYQGHGLSTVLLRRVALWAHSHEIEYLYAETDELQLKLAEILEKRHGYTLVSTKKKGSFKTETLWKLDVKLWMSLYLEEKKAETLKEELKKEDEELKKYE